MFKKESSEELVEKKEVIADVIGLARCPSCESLAGLKLIGKVAGYAETRCHKGHREKIDEVLADVLTERKVKGFALLR